MIARVSNRGARRPPVCISGRESCRAAHPPTHSRPPPAHTPLPAPALLCTSTTPRRRIRPRHHERRCPAARLACDEACRTRMGGEDPTHRKFYNENDVIKSMPEKRMVLTIDPNELKEGICKIYPSKDEKFAVCLEDEKIKIFPIEE